MTGKLPPLALLLLAGCATPGLVVNTGPEPVVITEDSPAQAAAPDAPPPPQKRAPASPGNFQIVVTSAENAQIAAQWLRKSEAAGYRAEVQAVDVKGKTWHRVLLTGYATLTEATAALPAVKEKLGASGAWVKRRS
ncbi:MAG: SPOR domain-containing protein [Gammaproteobacteria bacterium]